MLSPVLEYLDFENQSRLLIVTLFFLLATAFTVAIRLYNIWLNGQTCAAIGSDISDEFIQYFYKVTWHVSGNTSNFISELTNNVTSTITFIG